MVDASDPVQLVQEYFGVAGGGDARDALALLSDDVVFDVGRGRYEGIDAVRSFMEMLAHKHTATEVIDIKRVADGPVIVRLENRDDDLRQLGIDSMVLDAEIDVERGRITRFAARPSPESLARLRAAQEAGKSAEGLRLAERAGTLPPREPSP